MKQEEKQFFENLMTVHPDFLEATTWMEGPDPPDVIITDVHGQRLGIELTEWLDETQTNRSIAIQEAEYRWLAALDTEHRPQPIHFGSVQISFDTKTQFSSGQQALFCKEFYALISHVDTNWDSLFGTTPQQKLWQTFKDYPTLGRHVQSLWFIDQPILRWRLPEGARWVSAEPKGGAYDPRSATIALLSRISNKTNKPGYVNLKAQLDLEELVLLLHYGLRGIMHNTPFEGVNWKLDNTINEARVALANDPGPFDRVFLYFAFNEGKLVSLYP